jgi:hypothetical protein
MRLHVDARIVAISIPCYVHVKVYLQN